MKLTQKLLGYLSRVFDKGPGAVLALRLRYDGAMRWSVADGVLSTAVVGGSGVALSIQLSGLTVAALAAQLASQPGYAVPYVDAATVVHFSALSLIDGSGDQDQSNGDHLVSYTSVLWAYLEGQAQELTTAGAAIREALVQMSATSASGEWVDEHGTYYQVVRSQGEADAAYAARMIAEVGRARGNNIAVAEAVRAATNGTDAGVIDVDAITLAADLTPSYGLFDLVLGLDINSVLSAAEVDHNARSVLEAMRDAGTHLRTLRYVWNVEASLYASSYLQVGSVVTVLAGDGITHWINQSGQRDVWTNVAGQAVGWFAQIGP